MTGAAAMAEAVIAALVLTFLLFRGGELLAGVLARIALWMTGDRGRAEPLYAEGRRADGRLPRHGRARTALAPRGKVFVSGELWDAEAEAPVAAGERVEVLSRAGLLLRVRPAEDDGAEGSMIEPEGG